MFKKSCLVLISLLSAQVTAGTCETVSNTFKSDLLKVENQDNFLILSYFDKKIKVLSDNMHTRTKREEFKIINSKLKCRSVSIVQTTYLDSYEQTMNKYDLENCNELNDKKKHLLFFNRSDKTVIIANELKSAKNIDKDTIKIDLDIKKHIDDIGIIPSDTKHNKLDKKDIVNFEKLPIEHFSVGKNFVMSVADLEIKNLTKFYVGNSHDISDEDARTNTDYLNKSTAEFPIVFFTVNKATSFIGSSSICANSMLLSNVFVAKDNKSFNYKLGKINTINFNAAFDSDGDAEADIVQLESFNYYKIEDSKVRYFFTDLNYEEPSVK